MSTAAHDILERFDGLPEADNQEVASEILRRTRDLELVPRAYVGSPRLVRRKQLSDFYKKISRNLTMPAYDDLRFFSPAKKLKVFGITHVRTQSFSREQKLLRVDQMLNI